MKPVARDAGSRRRLLQAAALLAGLCVTAGAAYGDDRFLNPLFSISGARLITRMNIAGGVAPDAFGAYAPLIFPVAAAASFNDVYIADAGASRLYRYDRTLDAMAVMPEQRISPTTRLHAAADGSVFVLDTFASEIRRYSRSGQALPTLHPHRTASRYTGFTVDPLTGKAYAVDSAYLAIDEIQPLGQLSIELQRLDEAGPIATDGRGLFVGSARCGCVVEWLHGHPGRRFGAGRLRQPLSVAVDGPNVFVIDAFDRSIALAHEEGVESATAASLGMLAPDSLSVANGMLLIADGAGRRVAAFRSRTRHSQ